MLVPLDEDRAREQVRQLKEAGVEAVSVCFLFSFLNPEHEQRVAEIVREEFPEAFLSVSSEVLPQYREYERFSTVCLNAYVGPKVSRYVRRLEEQLRGAGGPDEAPPDDLGERRRDARGRGRATGQPAHVGPGRGRRRRHLGREAGRLRQRDHARRRRHLGRHRPRAGGPPAHEAPARHQGRALPGDDPDGRRRHDRRRRRLDRLRRPRRHLPRRPALGRRRPGPGGLRPRRHRADGDRRDGEPRLARPRGVPRRADGAARRPRARRVRGRAGHGARNVRRGGVDGRRADPHALDGAVDRGELRPQGLRPARLRARRRGRRRAAVRGADRARGRARPGCSSRRYPGITVGAGPARDGHGLRVRLDRLPAALAARRGGARSGSSRSSRSRRARSSRRTACRRTACSSQRVADCRYLGQGYELRVDAGSGAIDDAWVEQLRGELPRHPRARVLAPVRGVRHRDPERPRPRDRADAGARDARGRARAPSRPTRRSATRATPGSASAASSRRCATRFYDRAALQAGNRLEGPGDRQPVRLDDGDPARRLGARRPLREHRHRHRRLRRAGRRHEEEAMRA